MKNFDINKYKSNTVFIIPYIVQNRDLLTNIYIKKTDIQHVGLDNKLIVEYQFNSIKQYKYYNYILNNEENIFNVTINKTDDTKHLSITAKFYIPKYSTFTTTMLYKCGSSALVDADIKKCAIFWGDYTKYFFNF